MTNLLKIKEKLWQLAQERSDEPTYRIMTLLVSEIVELQKSGKAMLTFKDACAYTGYSPSHLRKMVREHTIPYYKPTDSGSGKLFFKREELDTYMTGNRFAALHEADEAAANYLASL